jgi:hypothetical protein
MEILPRFGLLFIILLQTTQGLQSNYYSTVPSAMASRTNKIDIEWANSLVGLPVKIPDNWWVGYTGTYLHDGKLVAFDASFHRWNSKFSWDMYHPTTM